MIVLRRMGQAFGTKSGMTLGYVTFLISLAFENSTYGFHPNLLERDARFADMFAVEVGRTG